MADIRRWPDDFADPTPAIGFDSDCVALLEEMHASGTSVLVDHCWSLFEFCRDDRSIHFVRRGRSRKLDGVHWANREVYWEVCPVQNNVAYRLGSLCGIREFACVVVCGVPNIRLIKMRWLNGAPLVDAVSGITLWDRLDPSIPLQAVASIAD